MSNNIEEKLKRIFNDMYGKKCCRVNVGEYKSLSVGFGDKIYHNNPRLNDDYYGEWEIGTYSSSWRIISNKKIVCASNDSDENGLNKIIKKIEIGSFIDLKVINEMDIRVVCDNNLIIDFLVTVNDDDDLFHIFCPNNIYIELLSGGKWDIRNSS